MTTNHPESLDAALLRPGRVDRRVEFANATAHQARRLFLRFFPGEEELAQVFAEGVEDEEASMATLQERLLQFRDDPEAAARGTEVLVG